MWSTFNVWQAVRSMSWERMAAELGFARIRRSAPPTTTRTAPARAAHGLTESTFIQLTRLNLSWLANL